MAYDPYAAAATPEVRAPEYFGQVAIDIWACTLQKGVGKVPFNEGVDDPNKRCTAVQIQITPLAEHNTSKPVGRDLIAESREWAGIVLPSIKDAWPAAWGEFSLRALAGKWCKVSYVPTGGTYVKDGETKQSTTLKFLALYANEAECRTAYNTGNGTNGNGHTAPAPAPAAAAPTNGTPNPAERQTALVFLKALVKQSGGDLEKVQTAIAGMPLVARHFNLESPETAALVAEMLLAA